MSHLTYYNYPGYGQHAEQTLRYSQAVCVGDRIECSGQGGWKREMKEGGGLAIDSDIKKEIDQAFENCQVSLETAGGKGWPQVYRANSYHTVLDDTVMQAMIGNFEKWMPDHKPLWTCIGVAKLADKDMKVEIEVIAHIG